MAMKGIRIKLEGTSERLELAVKRIRQVFSVSRTSKLSSADDEGIFYQYLMCYMYEEPCLAEQLDAAKIDIGALEQMVGELKQKQEVDRLRSEKSQPPARGLSNFI